MLLLSGSSAAAGSPAEPASDLRPIQAEPVVPGFPIGFVGVTWDTATLNASSSGSVRFEMAGEWGPWIPLTAEGAQADGQWGSSLIVGDGARAYQITGIPPHAIAARAMAIADDPSPPPPAGGSPVCVSRAEWGADESIRFIDGIETWPVATAPAQVITVHHTATANSDPDPAATMRAIYRFHTLGREWGDIAYHYLIDAAGRIYEGRWSGTPSTRCGSGGDGSDFAFDIAGDLVIAGHVHHRNQGNIGIALLGNFGRAVPTAAAIATLQATLDDAVLRHELDALATVVHHDDRWGDSALVDTISAHNHWPAPAGDTACPGGNLEQLIPRLREIADVPVCDGTTSATIIDPVPGKHVSMITGSSGFPFVAYQSGGDLVAAACTSADCAAPSISTVDAGPDGGETGAFSSMAMGVDGYPVIGYVTEGHLTLADCATADCSAAAITTITPAAAGATSMIVGPDGFPTIAYYTERGLNVVDCSTADCSAATVVRVDAAGVAAETSAMIAGPDGFPTIVFSVGTRGLKVADCSAADCSAAISTRVEVSAGTAASMVAGWDGFPILAYRVGTTLRMADCATSDCSSKSTITIASAVASTRPSIAIGPDGFALVAYRTASALQMADCAIADCSVVATTTVDATSLHHPLTLQIGADGVPAVSYRSAAGVSLARITCGGTCGGEMPTIIGTTGDDHLNGTPGDDVILGLGGSDLLMGLGGNDTICGNQDGDTLIGGRGDDTLIGATGNDKLKGQAGADRLDGGYGADRLLGGPGDDIIEGDDGKDIVRGGGGSDIVTGGHGNDRLRGDLDDDILSGGAGLDRIWGGPGDDYLEGGAQKDFLYGDSGTDVLKGGTGSDYLYGGDDDDRLFGHRGDDTLDGQAGTDFLNGGRNQDSCSIEATTVGCEVFI